MQKKKIAQRVAMVGVFDDGELVAVVCRDPRSKHQVFYRCEEMDDEAIAHIITENSDTPLQTDETE